MIQLDCVDVQDELDHDFYGDCVEPEDVGLIGQDILDRVDWVVYPIFFRVYFQGKLCTGGL